MEMWIALDGSDSRRLPLPKAYYRISGSIVMATSAPAAASRGVAAMREPRGLSASARARVRLKRVSVCPALSKLVAMAEPMLPKPMNAMFIKFMDAKQKDADIHLLPQITQIAADQEHRKIG